MRYHKCKKPELHLFALNRGLQVTDTSKHRTGPTHNDYVRALKQADSRLTFRFLDLPPELRNIIYRELLTLRNSFSCHPQILATSKNINAEATTLLYVENLIEVKLYHDGVYTHGRRCGNYWPLYLNQDVRKIVWPEFLRRAQHLRFSVEDLLRPGWALTENRLTSIDNVLNSFCMYLHGNHQMRSFQLDLNWPQQAVDRSGSVIYPLRLLGQVPLITIGGGEEYTKVLTKVVGRDHISPLPSRFNHAFDALVFCGRVYSDLLYDARRPITLGELSDRGLVAVLLRGLFRSFYAAGAWEEEVFKLVEQIRIQYERSHQFRLSQRLRDEIVEVKQLGVDMLLKQAQQPA